ncbi:MAG: iron-containing alcohol dehydrogenase [Fusobacteriaceae bacterium]
MFINYHIPTKIIFGAGKLQALKTEKLPGKKALIITTAGGSLKKYGILEKVISYLKENSIETIIYDKIISNPIKSHVMEGADIAKKENCDFVIGLGGGSSIDSAKAIAIMAKNSGDYWDYIKGGSGKKLPVKNGALPIVAITTTAGTGTEVNPWTVITKEETNEKTGFGIPETFPTLAIVDPELTLTVPKHLTAYQGFDALFHATEGYIANVANEISDVYALKSIELLAKNLPIAMIEPNNIEARTNISLANTLSGMVESTSDSTSAHSMEHSLSAFYPDLPHGAGLIMLADSYYTFFSDKVDGRMLPMAKAMGYHLDELSYEEKPYAFVYALRDLMRKCEVDKLKMSDYGIKIDEMEKFAKNARDTSRLFDFDRYKLSFEETVNIMKKSYK